MQPAALKIYMHHAVLKCDTITDVIAKGTWHADLKVLLVAPLYFSIFIIFMF